VQNDSSIPHPDPDPALAKLRSELSTLEDLKRTEHIARVETLRAIYPHSIGPANLPNHMIEALPYFNCFEFAFRLIEAPVVLGEFRKYMAVVFDPMMVAALMADLQEKEPSDVVNKDLAIYFSDTGVTHAGIVKKPDEVLSKWGTGYIWFHGTFEIPAEYGQIVRYYAAPPFELMVERFRAHALQQMEEFKQKLKALSKQQLSPSQGSRQPSAAFLARCLGDFSANRSPMSARNARAAVLHLPS
jgi:hypothetical protein